MLDRGHHSVLASGEELVELGRQGDEPEVPVRTLQHADLSVIGAMPVAGRRSLVARGAGAGAGAND